MPIPVPVFIPTTRNSGRGILKQIKKIQAKMPSDPYEAEVLALAGALTGDNNVVDDDISDDSEEENLPPPPVKRETAAAIKQERHASGHSHHERTSDMENEIAGGRVLPKPLPLATPDPRDLQNIQHRTPDSHESRKRKHSNFSEYLENSLRNV